jgi:aspartate carbamoyltransferase catalytic subunit
VRVCGPPTLIPYAFEELGVEVFYDLDKALANVDVIIMLRVQHERQQCSFFPTIREYVEKFSLSGERLKKIPKQCLIMHPGPVNWDVEISSQIKEALHPLILRQVENGLAIRMATLYLVGTQKRTYEPSVRRRRK